MVPIIMYLFKLSCVCLWSFRISASSRSIIRLPISIIGSRIHVGIIFPDVFFAYIYIGIPDGCMYSYLTSAIGKLSEIGDAPLRIFSWRKRELFWIYSSMLWILCIYAFCCPTSKIIYNGVRVCTATASVFILTMGTASSCLFLYLFFPRVIFLCSHSLRFALCSGYALSCRLLHVEGTPCTHRPTI